MAGRFERSEGGVVVYEGGQTYPRRGKAGKIGSSFGRYIVTFKMIEKECFVKVIFIGRNFDIGRIKATIFWRYPLVIFIGRNNGIVRRGVMM